MTISIEIDVSSKPKAFRRYNMQVFRIFARDGLYFCPNAGADEHVDIKLALTDLDLTSAEAACDAIKAYVLEPFGVKVLSLYISQVKCKLGLDVCENFNNPKTENAKQRKCPPDKEKRAPPQALKHFKMVK